MYSENNNAKKIEEEIRQFKLQKISDIENKLGEYESTFNRIKENIVIKFTKNVTSTLFRILLSLITIILFFTGVFCLFPTKIVKMLEQNRAIFSKLEKEVVITVMPYIGCFIILIAIFLIIVTSLLKKNIRKRNTIYHLSKLLKEVIGDMNVTLEEDKKKYEYFVDSCAEIEDRKK